MRIASIDIGTNSFILLIAEIKDGEIVPIHQEFAIPRLGEDRIKDNFIQKDALNRASEVLHNFRHIIEDYQVERVLPVATAVLRFAENKTEVRKFLSNELGYDIRILSGEEEAYLSFLGVSDNSIGPFNNFTTIDIGGGSTEIISGSKSGVTFNKSFEIGAAVVRDLFFKKNEYSEEKIKKAIEFINQKLNDIPNSLLETEIIGVGGTITTLAFIKSGLKEYDSKIIDKILLTYDELEIILKKIQNLTPNEIAKLFGIHPKRADILLPGELILLQTLQKLKSTSIRVSSRGLRFGVIKEYLNS